MLFLLMFIYLYYYRFCNVYILWPLFRQGSSRFLTVYKKEGSTIVQADAVFELGHTSQRHTLSLLQRFPVTPRERQELLPPTERDRSYGQESNNFVSLHSYHYRIGSFWHITVFIGFNYSFYEHVKNLISMSLLQKKLFFRM